MTIDILNKEDWKKFVPSLKPEEEGINLPHLERLNYNPNYYTTNGDDLKIGDDIVVGVYASTSLGNPSIRWTETKVTGLPLKDFYNSYITSRRLLK